MAEPPKNLNERHKLLAYLVAAGFTNKQCSTALARNGTPLHFQYISTLKQNPLFKKLVREIQTEHMGGTVRSVLAKLAQEAMPSLKTMSVLRDHAEDEGVRGRMADRLFSSFEKATGLGQQREGDKGPLVQVNLNQVERDTFMKAIHEKNGGEPIPDAELVQQPKALPAPTLTRSVPRAKTIAELCAELGPCEKYVESGAV